MQSLDFIIRFCGHRSGTPGSRGFPLSVLSGFPSYGPIRKDHVGVTNLLGKIVCLITRTDKLKRRGDKIVGTRASDLFSKVTKVILSYKA